jgi:hypothetical protein
LSEDKKPPVPEISQSRIRKTRSLTRREVKSVLSDGSPASPELFSETSPASSKISPSSSDKSSASSESIPSPETSPPVLPPQKSAKSSAQVAISVGQNVLQKSCEHGSEEKGEKTGPPKYPPPLRVRYPTYEERARVIRDAKEAGFKSVSAYLRELSRGPNYNPPPDPALTQELHEINLELTRQGTNLNQIAKKVNGGVVTGTQANDMLGIIGRSLIQVHRRLREKLARGEPEPKP